MSATTASRDPLTVDLGAFSGPIDLLLELLSRRKLQIDEISVSRVVEDYLACIEAAGIDNIELDVASKFLLVAVTLMHIKTSRLLPDEESVEVDEDLLVDAERDVFLARLLAARTFKDVATVLQDALDDGSRYFPRVVAPEEQLRRVAPELLRQIRPEDLARIAVRVLADKPKETLSFEHVKPILASIQDALRELVSVLPAVGKTSFRRIVAGKTRIEAIVRFMAVLELVKKGSVAAGQSRLDEDVSLTWIQKDSMAGSDVDGDSAEFGIISPVSGERPE